MHRLIIIAALAAAPAPAYCMDVAATVATKALAGEFGQLAEWQRVGYTRLMERGTIRRTAWITHYWTGKPGVGTRTASGRRVEAGRTAAMLEPRRREWPYGTFVLVEVQPGRHELRQVWDTGSTRNAARARSRGAQTWIDLFVTRPTRRSSVGYIYVVNKEGWQ